jgi:hypothetical protein
MARESGIDTPTADDLVRIDRNRKGKKLSNDEWTSKTDPEAKIAKLKDGRTHLAYKPEHAVDLDTGIVVAAARENVHKRYLVHVAGHNLGILMRLLIGAGTPREAAARALPYLCFVGTEKAAAIIFVAALRRVCHRGRGCCRRPCLIEARLRQRAVRIGLYDCLTPGAHPSSWRES